MLLCCSVVVVLSGCVVYRVGGFGLFVWPGLASSPFVESNCSPALPARPDQQPKTPHYLKTPAFLETTKDDYHFM